MLTFFIHTNKRLISCHEWGKIMDQWKNLVIEIIQFALFYELYPRSLPMLSADSSHYIKKTKYYLVTVQWYNSLAKFSHFVLVETEVPPASEEPVSATAGSVTPSYGLNSPTAVSRGTASSFAGYPAAAELMNSNRSTSPVLIPAITGPHITENIKAVEVESRRDTMESVRSHSKIVEQFPVLFTFLKTLFFQQKYLPALTRQFKQPSKPMVCK